MTAASFVCPNRVRQVFNQPNLLSKLLPFLGGLPSPRAAHSFVSALEKKPGVLQKQTRCDPTQSPQPAISLAQFGSEPTTEPNSYDP